MSIEDANFIASDVPTSGVRVRIFNLDGGEIHVDAPTELQDDLGLTGSRDRTETG